MCEPSEKKDHSSSYTVQIAQWTLHIFVHCSFEGTEHLQKVWLIDVGMVIIVSSQYFHTTSLLELANCSFCLSYIYYHLTLFYNHIIIIIIIIILIILN